MGANAQTTVPTFTAGEVLTAAQQNASARTGVPVFASTATRNAAFGGTGEKTLAEGQMCWLEGVGLQVYNAAGAWMTISPQSALVTTSQTTASTTYTDLSTVGPEVTLETGTIALVTISATFGEPTNDAGAVYASFAVSGATTLAASDGNAITVNFSNTGQDPYGSFSRTFRLTGLTAGSNTFTMKYRIASGTSVSFRERSITVEGCL